MLQMPLVCIKPQELNVWYLVEFIESVDYRKFASICDALCRSEANSSPITKTEIKSILDLAQSDRERELIRYSVFRASGLSYTATRKAFGFERMKD